MKIYYPIYPITFYDKLTLVYDYTYTKPIKHFKFDFEFTTILRNIIKGQPISIIEEYSKKISSLDFIKSIVLPISNKHVDTLIIDFSIGGPSLWGKNLQKHLILNNKKVVFYSLSRRELFINSKEIDLENIPNKKIVFTTIARYLCQYFIYKKCIIIGREIGTRMFDILDNKKTKIIETGFGEESIGPLMQGNKIFDEKIINELLFRENTYPWDSVANTYGSSICIEKFKNIIWSESIVNNLKQKFLNADIQFQPPSISLDSNKYERSQTKETLSILVGLGNHQSGESSFKFLNLEPLLEILSIYKIKIKITILAKQIEKLKKIISIPEINFIEFSTQQNFFNLLCQHDIYYRVQNDQSIPISVIEAMSKGCVCIINKKCINTWSKLVDSKNIVLVNHGDVKELELQLKNIIGNKPFINKISNKAIQLVNEYCDLENNLIYLGIK